MLDDLKFIHEKDVADTLGIAERQAAQLRYEFHTGQQPVKADNIVYAGMGGSALAADVSRSWPGYDRPFEVVRGYDLPAYVSDRTYFIAASYSGNTEEILSALVQAEERGAQIAVIAGGGQLADIARAKGYPLAELPKAEQPRYAVLYNLRALLQLLVAAGLQPAACLEELASAEPFLQSSVQPWLATVPTAQNPAKQLALECIGKSAVIYAGPKLAPAAYKWKISFNENAKQVAWTGTYPEFNHNEFIGWSKQPVDKPYAVIDLCSSLEHPRVQKRFEVTERLLSGMRPSPHVVEAQGSTLLEQLLWVIAYGDFVTLYTALLNGLNPAPVELVEKFKKSLEG
jgi:glucose/mannose-6-phosphate isomerase